MSAVGNRSGKTAAYEMNGLRNLIRSDLQERIRRALGTGEIDRAQAAERELRELDELR